MTAGAIFAVMLGVACVLASEIAAGATPPTRRLIRLASALYLGLGCAIFATAIRVSDTMLVREMVLIVFSLAPAALVLALVAAWERPPSTVATAAVLITASVAGLVAAAGAVFVGFAALFVAVCAILALVMRHFGKDSRTASIAAGAALTLVAGAAALLSGRDNSMIALSTFSSAAIVGLSLACSMKRVHVVQKKISPQRHEGHEGDFFGA